MGKFNALLDALGIIGKEAKVVGNDAAKALEKVTTAETAVGLKGEARGQYLKALDEIYGDQAKRAAEMGFSPETYYHGTGIDFPAFDPKYLGSHTGPGATKDRLWFTDNPETAEIFSSSSAKLNVSRKFYEKEDKLLREQGDIYNALKNSIPNEYNVNNLLQTSSSDLNRFKKIGDLNQEQIDLIKKINDLDEQIAAIENIRKKERAEVSGHIIPVKLKLPKNLTVKDMQGKYWSESASEIPENIAIKLKNFRESTPLEEAPSATSIGLNNPARVRSQFAAFDPRFKDSPLLMAGGLAGANIGDMNEMIPKGERYKRALDEELSMVPKEMLQKGLHWWEKQKEKVTKPLAESLLQNPSLANLPPEVQQKLQGPISPEALSKGLSAVFDPVNLISGPAGLAVGASQMLTPSDEEMAKQEQEQAMRRKVLNQLAGQ